MKMKQVLWVGFASLIASSAFAGVPTVPKIKTSTSPQVSTGGASDVSSTTVVVAAEEQSCKTENTISLELFKNVMVQDGAAVTIKKNWNHCPNGGTKCGVNFTLTIPAHIQNCMSLQAIPRTDSNNVYMEFKNNYAFSAENVLVPEGKKLEEMTAAEKYEGCLRKSGILEGDTWNMKKATIGVTMLTVPKKMGDVPVSDEGFDKAQKSGGVLVYDNKADSKILGLSSIDFAKEYPIPSSEIVGVDNPAVSGCFQAHSMGAAGNLDMSKDLELRSRAKAACESKVYEEGVKVENDIGNNFSGLSKETQDVVLKLRASLREERAKKSKELLDELIKMAGDMIKSTDEEEVRALSINYTDKLRAYDKEITEPLYAELESLYKMRAESKDPRRQLELDKEIAKVGEILGRYSAASSKSTGVADKMLEFGLSLDASTVYTASQKSKLYKEVRHTGNPKRKPQDVEPAIQKLNETYSKRIEFAEKIYAARTGAASYSNEYQQAANRYRTQQQKAWSSYQQEEQKYAQYCQIQIWGTYKNPSRCKYGIQTYQQRYQQAVNSYNSYNNRAATNEQYYSMFAGLEAQARRNAQATQGGPYGADSSYYDPYGGDALYNFSYLNNYMGDQQQYQTGALLDPNFNQQLQQQQGFQFTGQQRYGN